MRNINEAQNNILAIQVPSGNAMREPLLTHGKVCPSVSYRRCYIIDKKNSRFCVFENSSKHSINLALKPGSILKNKRFCVDEFLLIDAQK